MARGRSRLVGGHLRLPDVVVRCQAPGARLRTGVRKMQWVADYLDRYTHQGRLHLLVGTTGRTVLQLLCMIAGGLMPLLEVVPFSGSILGAAVLSFSVGLLRRNGVFAAAGLAIMSIAAVIPMVFLQSVFW